MPATVSSVDERLYQYATVAQLEKLEAINAHGSMRRAAKALGLNKSAVLQALQEVKRKAAISGYSPEHDLTRPVAPGQMLRGASTLYRRGEPEPVLQWVKSSADAEQRDRIIRESIKALMDDVRGLAPVINPPKQTASNLLTVYPFGDPHFGMYAWAQESGSDFDLATARDQTLAAVDRLVATSPPSDTCIVLPLGDIFHANDATNQTPGHKHPLDTDGRFVKVLGVGIQTFRHAILRALEKHQNVVVRFVSGNHDPQAVWSLAFTISAYFEDEPRVTVDLSPAKHWFYRFGKVLIGATHGDTTKHPALLGVMAADRAEDWGQTKHRYWYTGHVHNQTVTELPGVVCESFRTLAARDAWAAGAGYRAGRDMRAIVLDREHGEVERHRVDVGMLV
jgi:hypothetical protein